MEMWKGLDLLNMFDPANVLCGSQNQHLYFHRHMSWSFLFNEFKIIATTAPYVNYVILGYKLILESHVILYVF